MALVEALVEALALRSCSERGSAGRDLKAMCCCESAVMYRVFPRFMPTSSHTYFLGLMLGWSFSPSDEMTMTSLLCGTLRRGGSKVSVDDDRGEGSGGE